MTAETRSSRLRPLLGVSALLVVAGVVGAVGLQWTGHAAGDPPPTTHEPSAAAAQAAAAEPVAAAEPAVAAPVAERQPEPQPAAGPPAAALVVRWSASTTVHDDRESLAVLDHLGVSYATGRTGAAFDVQPESFIDLKPNSALRLPRYSVVAWIQVKAGTRGGDVVSNAVDSAWNFIVSVEGGDDSAGKVVFRLAGAAVVGERRVDDGQWHQVAATFDGLTARIYVDGKLDASAEQELRLVPDAEAFVRLCAFDGLIDDLAIYSRALTAAELVPGP